MHLFYPSSHHIVCGYLRPHLAPPSMWQDHLDGWYEMGCIGPRISSTGSPLAMLTPSRMPTSQISHAARFECAVFKRHSFKLEGCPRPVEVPPLQSLWQRPRYKNDPLGVRVPRR